MDLERENELATRVSSVLGPDVLVARAFTELAFALRGMDARGGELHEVTGCPRELPPGAGELAHGLADGRHRRGHDLELGRRQLTLEPGSPPTRRSTSGRQGSQLTGLYVEQHQLLLEPDGELGLALESHPKLRRGRHGPEASAVTIAVAASGKPAW